MLVNQFPVLSETFVVDQLRGLRQRGYTLGVLRRQDTPEMRQLDELENEFRPLTWQPVQPRWRRWLRNARVMTGMPLAQVWALLADDLRGDLVPLSAVLQGRSPAYNLCHAHFGPQGELLARLRLLGLIRQPLVVSLHGYDVTRVAAGQAPGYRYLCTGADRIIVTTEFMRNKALSLGCIADRIRKVPVGIDTAMFDWAPRMWSPNAPLEVLSVARLVPQKGLDRGLRAVAGLVGRGVSVRYTIVGSGPCHGELLALARSLGIAHCVVFAGGQPREDVRRQLAASHVFLFPCTVSELGDEEGQGIVLLEAQACGLPILTTRHGGIPETVLDGVSAMVVPDAQDALDRGLVELLDDYPRWPDMGRAGRAHVERHFTVEKHVDALEAVYGELLDGAASGAVFPVLTT